MKGKKSFEILQIVFGHVDDYCVAKQMSTNWLSWQHTTADPLQKKNNWTYNSRLWHH